MQVALCQIILWILTQSVASLLYAPCYITYLIIHLVNTNF